MSASLRLSLFDPRHLLRLRVDCWMKLVLDLSLFSLDSEPLKPFILLFLDEVDSLMDRLS